MWVSALAAALLAFLGYAIVRGGTAPKRWLPCDDCGEMTEAEEVIAVGGWDWPNPPKYCPECRKQFHQAHPEYR